MLQTIHHGKNIRHFRLLQGMKQEVFARKMGIAQQNISKMEKRETISREKLEVVAKVLGISVEIIERFDENGLLKLAMEAKPEEVTGSVKEVIEYFKEELSKKDKRLKS